MNLTTGAGSEGGTEGKTPRHEACHMALRNLGVHISGLEELVSEIEAGKSVEAPPSQADKDIPPPLATVLRELPSRLQEMQDRIVSIRDHLAEALF